MLGITPNTGNLRRWIKVPSKLEYPAACKLIWRTNLLIIVCCLQFSGCRQTPTSVTPSIEFSKIPIADEGGSRKMSAIEGRVNDARPGRQIVLFARSGAWYVQP